MDIFNLSNLLMLGVVGVILLIYRQLDKNNRSLDKIRKFSDTVRADLESFIDQRTQEIKDFTVELEVHQKTGKEIIKRIKTVEEELEAKAPEMEALKTRIEDYGRRIDGLFALSNQVDENLNRLKEESEFVDKVGRRIKLAAEQIQEIEGSLPQLQARFHQDNAATLGHILEQYKGLVARETELVDQKVLAAAEKTEEYRTFIDSLEERKQAFLQETQKQFHEVLTKALEKNQTQIRGLEDHLVQKSRQFEQEWAGAEKAFHKRIDDIALEGANSEKAFTKRVEDLNAGLLQAEKAFHKRMEDTSVQAEKFNTDLLQKLTVKIQEQIKASANGWSASLQQAARDVNGGIQDLKATQEALRRDAADLHKDLQSDMEVLESRFAQIKKEAEESGQAFLARMEGTIAHKEDALQARMEELQDRFDQARTAAEAMAAADMAKLGNQISLQEKELQSRLAELRSHFDREGRQAQDQTLASLGQLDARIAEQEKAFHYRLESLESVQAEMGHLESNLKNSMEEVSLRYQRELEAFEDRMRDLQARDQKQLTDLYGELRTSLGSLDKELEELKGKAYDNVSEKLQVFEDEFFSDLQKRNAAMSRTFDDWHKNMQGRLQELSAESETRASDMERGFTGLLEEKQAQLTALAQQNAERLDSQIKAHQARVEESLETVKNRLEDAAGSLRQEMSAMEKSSLARVEQEIGLHEIHLKEALTKLERELEGKMKLFQDQLSGVQDQLKASVSAAESDINIWQTRFTQKVKETESELLEQYQNFKSSVGEKITAVKDEFAKQKDDLILSTSEERMNLKNEISSLRDSVTALESDLGRRSEAALETFRRDYEAFTVDFQKKSRDITGELDQRLKEFRTAAQDTRDKAEQLQKKLFGKIEDHYNLLTVNLEEIDKKQKSFISQTKVFERADTLKLELQESIEDLKNDIAKVDLQKKDLVEMDAQISRIRKMSDEITEKLAKFMAEKKRIDLLDSDFTRVLAVSQSVDERLKQISESHDMLQEIQLKIRKLEDYEKDVETRFDRLEKKRTILDTTTDAVDRNYSLLEKMERTVKDMSSTLGSMPAEMEGLKKRFKELSSGREESESAIQNLRNLSGLLTDIEKRTEKMEQARDWLARTETRLQEVSQEAEEQVKLLGTLVKSNPASGPKAKGAPAMDMRQTVVKLSHQGWSKEEISRATKLSLGEVELILELGAR